MTFDGHEPELGRTRRPGPSTIAVAFLEASKILGLLAASHFYRKELRPQALCRVADAAWNGGAAYDLRATKDRNFINIVER